MRARMHYNASCSTIGTAKVPVLMANANSKNANPKSDEPLEGEALIKETCRRIRAAKGLWDAHRNAACRGEREKALVLYSQLTSAQKEKLPQQLRIWLRYRSEKYFGPHQTAPRKNGRSGKKH
jgi:hypothetical protein